MASKRKDKPAPAVSKVKSRRKCGDTPQNAKHSKTVRRPRTPKPVNPVNESAWSCASCGTTDESVRYKSGKMANCYTCQAYHNARTNSKQKDGKRAGIKRAVGFTHEEFLDWASRNPRRCRYCGITDAEYFALGYLTSNGRRLEAVGLDRRDDGDYMLDSIDWCCYPCNRTKANSLTPEEMTLMGFSQEVIWRSRLGMDVDRDEILARVTQQLDRLIAARPAPTILPLEWQDPLTRIEDPETDPR